MIDYEFPNKVLKQFKQKLQTFYQLWLGLEPAKKAIYRIYINNVMNYLFSEMDLKGYNELKQELNVVLVTEKIKLSKYSTGAIFKLIIEYFPTIKLEAETELQRIGFKIL